MKRLIALLLTTVGIMSCNMDDAADEWIENGTVQVIEKDGIRFRFSLLNSWGEPATVFKEGEKFSFRFEMENLQMDDNRKHFGHLTSDLLASGLSEVFTAENDTAGRPFNEAGRCAMVLKLQSFYGDDKYVETIPWSGTEDEWNDVSRLCTFYRNHLLPLSKGRYYTGFTHTFQYAIPNAIPTDDASQYSLVEFEPLTFRINFIVE
jgi:hypothetical protein